MERESAEGVRLRPDLEDSAVALAAGSGEMPRGEMPRGEMRDDGGGEGALTPPDGEMPGFGGMGGMGGTPATAAGTEMPSGRMTEAGGGGAVPGEMPLGRMDAAAAPNTFELTPAAVTSEMPVGAMNGSSGSPSADDGGRGAPSAAQAPALVIGGEWRLTLTTLTGARPL